MFLKQFVRWLRRWLLEHSELSRRLVLHRGWRFLFDNLMSFPFKSLLFHFIEEAICSCNCFNSHLLVFQSHLLFNNGLEFHLFLKDCGFLIFKTDSIPFDNWFFLHSNVYGLQRWAYITELHYVILLHFLLNGSLSHFLLLLFKSDFLLLLVTILFIELGFLLYGFKWISKLLVLVVRSYWIRLVDMVFSIYSHIWFLCFGVY